MSEEKYSFVGIHKKIADLEKKFEEQANIHEQHTHIELRERIELLESRDKIVINNEIFDINKKIEKLEHIIGKPNFYKKDIGTIIDYIEKEIAELRKDFYSHASLIVELKEVLQKILKKSHLFLSEREELLKKLAGEKEVPVVGSENKEQDHGADCKATDSKPAELHCYCCGNIVKKERNCFCLKCFEDVKKHEKEIRELIEEFIQDLKKLHVLNKLEYIEKWEERLGKE